MVQGWICWKGPEVNILEGTAIVYHHLVLAPRLHLHPRHVSLDPVELGVRVTESICHDHHYHHEDHHPLSLPVLLLQTRDLLVQTHHLPSLIACATKSIIIINIIKFSSSSFSIGQMEFGWMASGACELENINDLLFTWAAWQTGSEAWLDVTAVLEHPGTHGEAGVHAASLIPVGVGAARGAESRSLDL